jgi:hypothetical protein
VWAVVSLVVVFLTAGYVGVSYWMAGDPNQAYLESCRRDYMEKEGYANRGPLFYQYLARIQMEQPFPPTMSDGELVHLIGPPDLWVGKGNDRAYLYRYTCASNGPSEVTVSVRDGVVWWYGYCTQGVNDYSDWRDYSTDPPPEVANSPK